MHRVTKFFIQYPIWTSMVMFSIIIFGLISLFSMRYSFFPEVAPDVITIQVIYPGASPEEVAEGVVLKIEENLDGLDGIERVTSTSRENIGIITVEIVSGTDLDRALADIKNAVDRINSFPVGIEKPVIFEQKFRSRSLSVALYGQADLHNLKYIAEDFRDELLTSIEISQVDLVGIPNLEFSIEVSEADMRRFGLTFNEIAKAVRESNVNISGGKFETRGEEILIRAKGRRYFARELQDIIVRGNPDGTVIYLRDIANIVERWEDVPNRQYFNGQTAVVLNIDQTKEEDILAIAEITKAKVQIFNESNDGIHAEIVDDRTIPLRQRLMLLVKNGLIGLTLIIIALGFFLRLRLSFWVAVAIPFSFAGMFIVAGFWGITINVISLFGMILVVGILVDDGVVVAENIFSHYERGAKAFDAALNGTVEVIAPVTTSILTTVIAFMPFFFFSSMMGKFIWQVALVVIASLLFSLVEAFIILPSHLAHSKALQTEKTQSKIKAKKDVIFYTLTHKIYSPILKVALKNKWITIMTPIALILFTVGLIGGGLIGVTIFPFIDGDTIPINVSMVAGRQEADTDSLLSLIEEKCWLINEEIKSEREDGRNVIEGIKRELGSNRLGASGSHAGQLVVQLMDGEERDMESTVISNRIREAVGPMAGVENITYGRVGHFGKPISISLLGNDLERLSQARDLLKSELENFSTLKDVTDTDQKGRREVNIVLKPRAYSLGLTLNDIAGQVRQGFFGQEIQRIQRGRDEIRVWARYREEDRTSLDLLDQMRIRTVSGAEYPFSELAEYSIERGLVQINHLDRKREVKVEANQSNFEDDLPPILEDIEVNVLPKVLSQVQGVSVYFGGQSREQVKFNRSLQTIFPVAIFGMYILIVLVFRSYAQALLIFSLIPIGILGAIWGHGLHGMQINRLSMFGIIALSGIIVNDSIILVDQINRFLRKGQKVYDAVYNAGLARLRPIILTTITTALGLAPLIMETSRQAQFLIPMAISVAYGLVFGTIILLIILPAAFLAFNSLRVKFAKWFTYRDATPELVEPAFQESNISLTQQTD